MRFAILVSAIYIAERLVGPPAPGYGGTTMLITFAIIFMIADIIEFAKRMTT